MKAAKSSLWLDLVLLQFNHRMPHLRPATGAHSEVPSNPTPLYFFLSYASMKTLPERLAS